MNRYNTELVTQVAIELSIRILDPTSVMRVRVIVFKKSALESHAS